MEIISSSDSSHHIICLECNKSFEDTYLLKCKNGCNSLLRPNFSKKRIDRRDEVGLFKYMDWLPVHNGVNTTASPITYHATQLGRELGLDNLYVSFNGYWPEKSAFTRSCSFKEYEAYPTFQRMNETKNGIIQIASAGNTARAFSIASQDVGGRIILSVPKSNLDRVWTINPDHDNILLFAIDGDYLDAIKMGKNISNSDERIYPEGGARNIARRAGMGMVMIDAVFEMGRLPDYYFQGVGSGTGGIANYEMSLNLLEDGRFGDVLPKFILSQNDPFTPMVNAWEDGRRFIIPEKDMPNAIQNVSKVYAPLLTNREPPYSVKGGVFDTLQASQGDMISVNNDAAIASFNLFETVEGIDIDPSAAVALASLIKRVEEGHINQQDDYILLNVSGGGYNRIAEDYDLYQVKPISIVNNSDLKENSVELIREFI